MPVYEWGCACGSRFERYLPYSESNAPQHCECGSPAKRVISAPMLKIAPDVHYRSPIDDRPVTTMKQRLEDMARSGCIEYDPGMKQDANRRVVEADKSLDRAVDDTVDAAIEAMPSRQRESLESEMRAGMTCEPVRLTPTE